MNDLTQRLADALPDYLRDLETLVNIDCGTQLKPGVDAVARVVRERMREFGAEVTDFPHDQFGNMLYGQWRGQGTTRIFLIGHMDTVYSEGTVSQFPFRRLAGRAMGPGVIDMKAGILAGLYAIRAITQAGFDPFAEIGMFCNSEEEIGSPVSRGLYASFAKNADVALVLEPARESGAIVSARKGVAHYHVKVRGKSAHAGVEPDKGANAILALAQHIVALQALNGFRPGLTLNVGVVRGGIKSNVVADSAEADIDVRVVRADDAQQLEQAMRDAIAKPVVPGTSAELTGGISNPPMEKTKAITRLATMAKDIARDLGFELQDVATGGGSDGNYTAALGTPTLDGLGPVGGKAHNAQDEYLVVDSIVPRTALLAHLLVAIASKK